MELSRQSHEVSISVCI